MRHASLAVIAVMSLAASLASFGIQRREPPAGPSAEVSGRVSSQFVAGVEGATVYLFTMEQSKSLRELREKTRRLMLEWRKDSVKVTNTEAEFYNRVADIVPRLPRVVKTKASTAGIYRFREVTAEKRYYVVSLDIDEDGVHFAAQTTRLVKPGMKVEVHLVDGVW